MKWIDRRALLRMGGLGLCGSGMAGYGYGPARELSIERVDCPLRPGHAHLNGLRVAALSDFHHDDFPRDELVVEAVAAANAFQPHLTFLLGDYVSSDAAALARLAPLLRPLRAEKGVYAILGNHDHEADAEGIEESLATVGVNVLRNRAERHEFGSGAFSIAGLESEWTGGPQWSTLRKSLPPDEPVILGWHEPDTFITSQKEPRLALQLSGHTHGGQVCAPWGALRLPSYGKLYVSGLFQESGASLYVSRGIGVIAVPFRLFCPPEVSCITFRV